MFNRDWNIVEDCMGIIRQHEQKSHQKTSLNIAPHCTTSADVVKDHSFQRWSANSCLPKNGVISPSPTSLICSANFRDSWKLSKVIIVGSLSCQEKLKYNFWTGLQSITRVPSWKTTASWEIFSSKHFAIGSSRQASNWASTSNPSFLHCKKIGNKSTQNTWNSGSTIWKPAAYNYGRLPD